MKEERRRVIRVDGGKAEEVGREVRVRRGPVIDARRREVEIVRKRRGDSGALSGDERLLQDIVKETELPDGTWVMTVRVPPPGSDDEDLRPASGVSGAIGDLHVKLGELVRQARADGYSWTQIGDALGISKQAAWERFSGED
ncbi:MAG TPA: hypothetical protein VNB24_08445 [Acidimicrobiales bacterium]|nr:hypothetical protein [Acidimicrobiales bacterium]